MTILQDANRQVMRRGFREGLLCDRLLECSLNLKLGRMNAQFSKIWQHPQSWPRCGLAHFAFSRVWCVTKRRNATSKGVEVVVVQVELPNTQTHTECVRVCHMRWETHCVKSTSSPWHNLTLFWQGDAPFGCAQGCLLSIGNWLTQCNWSGKIKAFVSLFSINSPSAQVSSFQWWEKNFQISIIPIEFKRKH